MLRSNSQLYSVLQRLCIGQLTLHVSSSTLTWTFGKFLCVFFNLSKYKTLINQDLNRRMLVNKMISLPPW